MKERLSITLSHDLYKEVKKRAEELREPVSHIVEKAIEAWRRDEIAESLKQYYTNGSVERKDIIEHAEAMIDEVW